MTDGWGRRRRDYYVQHDKPKRLFVRELVPKARRTLQAEHLKPTLAPVEKKAGARCYHKGRDIRALTAPFKVLPDKEPRHGPGDAILSAVTVPSQFYLGSALVNPKTNEIPVARALFGQLDLAGRWGALDALHTQDETARQLVREHGAHYLLTVKNNQPTLRQNIAKLIPVPPTGFSPSGPDAHPCSHGGKEQGRSGEPDP